jgi:hypothetical protein
MKRKKRKIRAEEIWTPEERARFERTSKLLLERIAYHEARIAARERGENPDAATA